MSTKEKPKLDDSVPEAKQRSSEKKTDKRRSTVWDSPYMLPGALGALAAGAYAAGEGIASSNDVADYAHAQRMWNKDNFIANNNPGNLSAYMQYGSTLAPMAGLRPFGVSPSSVLSTIRTSKDILELAGIPPSYSLLTDVAREGTSGAMHYEAYAKGPLGAYTHQLRNMQDVKVPDNISTVQGYKLENYPAWVRKLLDGHVRSKLQRHMEAKYPHLSPEFRFPGLLTPADEITKKLFSSKEQEQILKDFMGSLTPEQRQFILDTEASHAAGLASQVDNYAPIAKGVMSTRDALMDTSKVLGGAAGAGLAGNLAYRMLRGKDKRQAWEEALATGGSAGLGGLAAYALGTEGGRTKLMNTLKYILNKGTTAMKSAGHTPNAGAYCFDSKQSRSKKANQTAYPDYHGLAVQNFAPISSKRQLTPEDHKLIDEGKSQWFPGLFASEGDPMTSRMASPLKQSLIAGLAATLGGAAAGGTFANNVRGSTYSGALLGGGLGALAGLPAAVLTYLSQDQKNRSIEDRMKWLPEGRTTIRDMMSDPVTGQQERSRYESPRQSGNAIAQMALIAALAGRR